MGFFSEIRNTGSGSSSGSNSGKKGDGRARRGLFGFWNAFASDGWDWVFSSALTVLSSLPFFAGLLISLDSSSLLPMLITSPLGGLLIGPQLTGLADTLLRSFRFEGNSWWRTYRRSWKRNLRQSLLPGLLLGTLLGLQTFTLWVSISSETDLSSAAWVVFSLVLTAIISVYLIPLTAAVDLKFPDLLKSAVLLCFRKPLRTVAAAAVQLAYWGAIAWFFPGSMPVFIVLQFWLPFSISTALIYPPLEAAYNLEARVKELHGE